MENRPDHPEVLSGFESAPPRRVRWWAWAAMGLGLLLLAADWTARFRVFRWQDQWLPNWTPVGRDAGSQEEFRATRVPAQSQGRLAQMVPVPWLAARYAEFHPERTEYRDPSGYCNEPLPAGKRYDVAMVGDSFMLSLGTQNVAQVLASIGGIPVYNHGMYGAGPFLEIRKFLGANRPDLKPRIMVWNLSARELGAPLFSRQPVEAWFGRSESGLSETQAGAPRIRWDAWAPSELGKAWPNTSAAAYYARIAWSQFKLIVFRGWPRDVRGVEDPVFGPMLFYGENLRLLPLYGPERDAPAVVQTVKRVAAGFRERGVTLVVLLVPEKEQIYTRALPEEDRQALARGPELLAAIESGLRNADVPVVNLMPVFQEATTRGEQLYWRDDTHWNDAGIRLAAEELWRTVEPLLK